MKLKFRNSDKLVYNLTVVYHYLCFSERHWVEFDDSSKFQSYMEECHPGISYDKVRELFAKKYDELMALTGNENNYDESKKITQVHCCLCGEELFVSTHGTGVIEKLYAYKEASDKVNEGYIKTVLAHSWSFKQEGNNMVIRYWYDPENINAIVYKIHIFKDKVILGRDGKRPASVIVSDRFYVHYEGQKKLE